MRPFSSGHKAEKEILLIIYLTEIEFIPWQVHYALLVDENMVGKIVAVDIGELFGVQLFNHIFCRHFSDIPDSWQSFYQDWLVQYRPFMNFPHYHLITPLARSRCLQYLSSGENLGGAGVTVWPPQEQASFNVYFPQPEHFLILMALLKLRV